MVPAQQDSLRRQSRSCGDRPDPLRELLRSLPGIPAKLVYLARCRFNVQDRAVLDGLLDRRRDYLRVSGTDSVHTTFFRLSIAAQNILGPSARIEEMRVLVLLFKIRESDLPAQPPLETNLQSKLNSTRSSRRGLYTPDSSWQFFDKFPNAEAAQSSRSWLQSRHPAARIPNRAHLTSHYFYFRFGSLSREFKVLRLCGRSKE